MNTEILKEKLEKELELVERELEKIAQKNPQHPSDWETVEAEDADRIDADSVAPDLEEFAGNTAITADLNVQYKNILAALEKIKTGMYGICEVGGEKIPEERLMANPSAQTCVEHSKQ